MKKLTTLLICFFSSSLLFAQYHCGNSGTYSCSPPYQAHQGQFRSDSIPCIIAGQNTTLDIPIRPAWVGQIFNNDPTTMVILSVDSLPEGLCWSTCYVGDTFGLSQGGCIRLSGICTAPPGTYHIKFFTRYHVVNGTNNTGTGYFGYYGVSNDSELLLRVTNSNLPCFPIGWVGADNPYFVPYCSPPSPSIQLIAPLTCGHPATVRGSDGYLSYWWSSIDSAQQTTISAPGLYFLTVVDTLSACQITRAIDIPAPTGSVTIQGPSTITCDQHTAVLSTDDFLSYAWSTGDNTKQINISTPGTYMVSVTDTLSAYCQFADTFNVSYSNAISGQAICGVTVDSVTGKNLLIWNKNTPQLSRAFFRIEKETGINQFDVLADLPYDSLSSYLDVTSDPNVTNERYRLRVLDSCGNISAPSGVHETVHLSENTGLAGTVNLIWNKYQGTTYAKVNVLRQVNGGAWGSLGLLSGNAISFTDLNPPIGNLNYQIEVLIDSTCTPSRSTLSLLSNRINVNVTVTGIDKIDDVVSVFPNPMADGGWQLTVGNNLIGGEAELIDGNGRVVFQSVIRHPSSVIFPAVSRGVYLLRISSGKSSVVRKLVRL